MSSNERKAMARRTTVISEEEMTPDVTPDSDLVTKAPDDWEFETVIEESPTHVIFDEVGDVFVGQFVDRVTITPDNKDIEPFDLFRFRGRDGELYAVNTSSKLDKGMDKVKPDSWVRITLIKTIPSRKGNDFKDFRVEVKTGGNTEVPTSPSITG